MSGRNFGRRLSAFALDMVAYILGSALYAVSLAVFTSPNNIAPGGLSGIATLVSYLYGYGIGAVLLVLNIPVFIAGFIVLGWRFTLRSFFCTIISSVCIDAITFYCPDLIYTSNPLLAAMLGGVAMGLGLAVIFIRGGTTGGTDIVARIVSKYRPHITLGRVLMLFDVVVIAVSAVVYSSLEPAMYALVTIFISSKCIDSILYGLDTGKLMFIVTDKIEEVSAGIMTQLERGATVLKGKGAYTGEEKNVLMCAVRRNEAYLVRRIVYQTDPNAFIITGDTSEVIGNGFKPIDS